MAETSDAHASDERREILPFCQGTAALYTRAAPGKQGPNEDTATLLPLTETRGVLALADGAGGMPGGAEASRTAIRVLSSALSGGGKNGIREAVLTGFEQANAAIAQLGLGAASTLAVVVLDDGEVRSYHVGDSVVLVCSQRGKRKFQTVMHSPVGYALEAGVLDEEDAMVHEDRHLVSNLLGTADMSIELSSAIRLAAKDTLIVASDGLFDNLNVDEVVELMRKSSLEEVMEKLSSAALARMAGGGKNQPSKPDDLTFLLYRPT